MADGPIIRFILKMKHFLLSISLSLYSLIAWCSATGHDMIAPPFLKPGDQVAIVSPASSLEYSATDAAYSVLVDWGFRPVMGRNVANRYHGFAGQLEARKSDFLTALQDTAVKAIFCTNGGYGSVQLLCEIPLEEFRNNPKWIIGYSDITALHSAQVSAGVMSIHANMAYRMKMTGGFDSTSCALKNLLMGTMPIYSVESHPYNNCGKVSGVLVGGNLSVMASLAGSDYDFLNSKFMAEHDVILFIEDVHERIYQVDRLLHLLKIRGILSRLKGLIIGKFKDYRPEDGWDSMEDMLHSYLKDYNYPICYDFPVSHYGDRNFPMLEGCPVSLDVQLDYTTLRFNLPKP